MKNALDVVFGGITYWAFGFGLSFGAGKGSNPFTGMGCFFVDADETTMGYIFAVFLFQLSFATTATTIVSGSMAERTKFSAYITFSLVNSLVYSIPAHWMWSSEGFLFQLGAIDVAGCGPSSFSRRCDWFSCYSWCLNPDLVPSIQKPNQVFLLHLNLY